MSFPASTVTQQEAWDGIRKTAQSIKEQGEALSNESAAGDIDRTKILQYAQNLYRIRNDKWTTWAAVPGLEAYARNQIADQTLDLTAEYVAMRGAADAMLTWLEANLPSTGYAIRQTDFTMSPDTFTTAQTATFRTNVAALNATIA